jgi:hypothetical protein
MDAMLPALRSPAEERGAAELAELGARVIAQPVREWRQWARMLLRLPTSQPITFGYFHSSALEHEIDNELDTLNQLAGGTPSEWFPNGYYPNEQAMRWFCDAVWPALRARRSSLRLKIVGADPPRSVRRLASIAGVEVTGFVPDVRPHVRPAVASVAQARARVENEFSWGAAMHKLDGILAAAKGASKS